MLLWKRCRDGVGDNMTDIKRLTGKIISFRDNRDWKQFHGSKDVAISLLLEASELLEHFQWKDKKEIDEYLVSSKDAIAEELADVLYWVLLMSHDLKIDITHALENKLLINDKKYPVGKAKGSHTKYDRL
jgi:NTP pyrophosphatase (non-canonical NTP hydrolase)